MAGDGRSTDDITLPLLFLFHKEGNILLEALKEYREVEVLLSDKARDRGATLDSPARFPLSRRASLSVHGHKINMRCRDSGIVEVSEMVTHRRAAHQPWFYWHIVNTLLYTFKYRAFSSVSFFLICQVALCPFVD